MGLRDRLRRLVDPRVPSPSTAAPPRLTPGPSSAPIRIHHLDLTVTDRLTAMRTPDPGRLTRVVVRGPEEDAAAVVERLRARGLDAAWELV